MALADERVVIYRDLTDMCCTKSTVNEDTYPTVAVCLAAFNGIHWLAEQLDSILTQAGVAITAFISVDQSTDGTEAWIDAYAHQNTKLKILPHGEYFGGAAQNFFRLLRDIDFSAFDYISFSDQDDIWQPDKLCKAINTLTTQGCDGYSSNVTAFWPDGREMLIDKAQSQVEWDYLFESAGPGCTFVLAQKLALDLQAFTCANQEVMSNVWLHDWFTYAFARSHGYKWHIDKYPSIRYRQHANNQVGVNTGYKAFLHRMRFVLSGKALNQSSLLATLCGLEDHSFVKRWHKHSRFGLLYLAFQATQCRRKRSEQVMFFFSCVLLAIVGQKKS